jgi:hypothetical protein
MSNNSVFDTFENNKQNAVLFRKGQKVVFQPVNPNFEDDEPLKKYDATIFQDSDIDSSDLTHYLEFDAKLPTPYSTHRAINGDGYTHIRKDNNLSPSIKERINYSISIKHDAKNNKLLMKINFDDYENNNVVYMKKKINSRMLNDKKRSLKSVRSNPKNKSIRLYQNKHNQPVKITPSIIQIEKEIDEFHNKCEDGIVKLNEKLNAEIELQYGLQNGWFDNTIHRLGYKKSSKKTFSKRRTKSYGGKTYRKNI